jgi:hypothetical protein
MINKTWDKFWLIGRFDFGLKPIFSAKWLSTPWVNFTNILLAAFLYKCFGLSFFVLAVKVKLFIYARILAQMRS